MQHSSQQNIMSMQAKPVPTWGAYAACAWAMLFALMSFYWAAGGTLGLTTLGSSIQALARDPGFVIVVWLTGIIKVVGGLCVLTLVRPWLMWIPRRVKLVGAWVAGLGLILYGGFPFVVEGLLLMGILHNAGAVDWNGVRWHFFLWDPWWLLGGALLLLAAWQYQRSDSTTPMPSALR